MHKEIRYEGDVPYDRQIPGAVEPAICVQFQQLIADGSIFVDGEVQQNRRLARTRSTVRYSLPTPQENQLLHQAIDVDVIYGDENGRREQTCRHGVHPKQVTLRHPGERDLHRWPEIARVGEAERPEIVHRLDKDTSGVLIPARNETAITVARQPNPGKR